MKNIVRMTFLAAAFSLSASAQATIFYDWAPNAGSAGVGVMEFDMSIPDPANFSLQPLQAFSFQFVPSGGTVGLFDVRAPVPPFQPPKATFINGLITSLSMAHTSTFIGFNRAALLFSVSVSSCSQVASIGFFFCNGAARGRYSTKGRGSCENSRVTCRSLRLLRCLRSV